MKISGQKTKKRGRPRKVVQEKIQKPINQTIEESVDLQSLTDNWEGEGGYSPPQEEPPIIQINPQSLFRKSQWDQLDDYSKLRLNMTEEEFLTKEDVTGFGPNSYFTPRSER